MSLLYPDILECRGLVLVSPTHNYNITAWMKAFGGDERGFEKREVLGGLVLNDPEGSVATKLSKEFALFWDTGSWEVLIADLP